MAAQVAEMKSLLVSSLGDMKMEIQNLKSDVYAKKKRKVMHIHVFSWIGAIKLDYLNPFGHLQKSKHSDNWESIFSVQV